jgi:hypothetical protein
MATPLMVDSTKDEQRSVVPLLWSESVMIREIYGIMTCYYGGDCISYKKVYESTKRFKGRWTIVILTCFEAKEHIDQPIPDSRRISIDKITSEMSIRHVTMWCKSGLRSN